MPRGFNVLIRTPDVPRRALATWLVVGLAGVLLPGCGPRSQVVESPPPVELTDAQVRDLLAATIKSGDASSGLYMDLQQQLSSGGAASRRDAGEIRAMLDEMIVLNDPAKNRAYAEKILKKW
jgi:hypothetical protein